LGRDEECMAAMRAVPAIDLCAACHEQLDNVSMHPVREPVQCSSVLAQRWLRAVY
jgi:hypothetical protein